ncbi:nif-specific transcriptional activator NifA [Methylomonas sp. MO1]|jgi:Nif-specific regulatory protein|uniref:Nif-specific regulatory protein n=4 Tax=Methylomonas TaxID=416 RepID=A0A126T181_9GAMM|nr:MULTISPECIES: nif-specific transcriptional activator NifA [Methylomonas]AMK75842.1 nif-specific transcriptional activator NifA [Methylomonas denitrificans]MCQ8119366.1 nif-specific transcriptional activator NifA [Methylomonas sp. WSC-7]MDT4290644.1 nif-specific transcriptional activator NifA [Methylomonas sp. MO1]MDX8129804.1 nif-specific transcriptional activator NifA [Methylomonas sp. OY6]OAH98596.1 nif-specific transcriptional activator NifA [Methylomonas methanica]
MSDRLLLVESELDTLFLVSQLLNSTHDLRTKLKGILEILHKRNGLHFGMITLRDVDDDSMSICEIYGDGIDRSVRYQPGEGLVGAILDEGSTIVVERIADEPRFLSRLGVYNPDLPFIGSPLAIEQGEVVGILAAQPCTSTFLGERARFMEMVANLIAQSVNMLRVMERKQNELASERDYLKQTLVKNYRFENIIGHSEPMLKVFDIIRQVAKWHTTVLIRGESGTGKEVVASSIHFNSACANGPFLKLNCAALPDTLLESELFGHEKGAFSGAIGQRKGRFELADNGTLFLDEIGEISASFQAKLLRVLQEGEFERVGGVRTLKVNVRIIAATNRNLEQEVAEGNFREDLYYRLNVMPINMPPLRERIEDIPELASFLLNRISRQQGGRPLEIKESAIRILMKHDWPGNVRELENRLERAAIMSQEGIIDRDVIASTGLENEIGISRTPQSIKHIDLHDENMDERERVIAALEQSGWVQAKAARLLDMTPRQIAYRIQTLNINVKQI